MESLFHGEKVFFAPVTRRAGSNPAAGKMAWLGFSHKRHTRTSTTLCHCY
jgi:hypothetical protein